jgi:hypothetical protein
LANALPEHGNLTLCNVPAGCRQHRLADPNRPLDYQRTALALLSLQEPRDPQQLPITLEKGSVALACA